MHRGEDGLSLIELMVASALSLVVLGAVGAVLWTAIRTTRGAEQESQALQEARLALARVERDIRGAAVTSVPVLCNLAAAPTGYCLQIRIQHIGASDEHVRYRVEDTTLFRDENCTATFGTCTGPTTALLTNVANRTDSPPVPAFDCDVSQGDPRFDVTLILSPLRTIGGGGGRLELETAVTGRNLEQC